MASAEPKVSVIIPVYNSGELLRVAAASVLGQSYANVDLVIVDDGSSEPTRSICDQLAAMHSRVSVIHKANGGVSSAMNAGMLQATGEYFMIAASDDELHPETLTSMMPAIIAAQANVGCFGMAFTYEVGGQEVRRSNFAVENSFILESRRDLSTRFQELFERNYLSSVCNKVFDRHFLTSHDLTFNTSMAVLEDLDFVVRLLSCEPRILALPDVFYSYKHDVAKPALARRPNIDYVKNFNHLEDSLTELKNSIAIGPWEKGAFIDALIFRAYLIGAQIFFARPISHRKRFDDVRRYVLEPRVWESSHRVTSGSRAVRSLARLVAGRHVGMVYVALWGEALRSRMRRRWTISRHRPRANREQKLL